MVLRKTISILIIFQLIVFASSEVPKEERKNFTELVHQHGFNAKEFEVITEDGYILTLFRIPGKKKPVLLVHGLGDSANTWTLRGNKSLAVTLARKGYDVWAGNVRGNRYGRKHLKLNPDKDRAFWDFSLHEMGYFDWPAMIDRVLKETKMKKLYGIGHSQGVSSFLALASLRPEYNNKVGLLIGLAPAAFLSNTGEQMASIAKAGPLLLKTLEILGINELFADHNAKKPLLDSSSSQGPLAQNMPLNTPGADSNGTDSEFTSLLSSQYPAGVSRKTLEHFDQFFFSGKFAQYDYGALGNLGVYKNIAAPEYDLKKVSTKVAIMYGENDQIITVKDVQRLTEQLPNLVYNKAIDKKEWGHLDFVWSSEMDRYLFGPVIQLLQKYGW